MRSMLLAIALLGFAVRPAMAQDGDPNTIPPPPTIVQSIDPVEGEQTVSPLMGGVIGATTGLVALNMLTGGMMLTPVIGLTASNVLGGAWLGSMTPLPTTAQGLFYTTSTMAIAFTSGTIGYAIASR